MGRGTNTSRDDARRIAAIVAKLPADNHSCSQLFKTAQKIGQVGRDPHGLVAVSRHDQLGTSS
jgi:hypothetical protein